MKRRNDGSKEEVKNERKKGKKEGRRGLLHDPKGLIDRLFGWIQQGHCRLRSPDELTTSPELHWSE